MRPAGPDAAKKNTLSLPGRVFFLAALSVAAFAYWLGALGEYRWQRGTTIQMPR